MYDHVGEEGGGKGGMEEVEGGIIIRLDEKDKEEQD